MPATKPRMKVLISKKPRQSGASGTAPGARRTRIIVLSALAAIVAVAAWHYITLYRDLAGARDELVAAQERLSGVGFEADAEDLEAAGRRLDKEVGV